MVSKRILSPDLGYPALYRPIHPSDRPNPYLMAQSPLALAEEREKGAEKNLLVDRSRNFSLGHLTLYPSPVAHVLDRQMGSFLYP